MHVLSLTSGYHSRKLQLLFSSCLLNFRHIPAYKNDHLFLHTIRIHVLISVFLFTKTHKKSIKCIDSCSFYVSCMATLTHLDVMKEAFAIVGNLK